MLKPQKNKKYIQWLSLISVCIVQTLFENMYSYHNVMTTQIYWYSNGSCCKVNFIFEHWILLPERPAKQKDAGQQESCRSLLPPGRDVAPVPDEESPLLLVFNVEIIVDGYLGILATVSLGEFLYEQFVFLSGGLIAGKEVENNLHLYDGILSAGLY